MAISSVLAGEARCFINNHPPKTRESTSQLLRSSITFWRFEAPTKVGWELVRSPGGAESRPVGCSRGTVSRSEVGDNSKGTEKDGLTTLRTCTVRVRMFLLCALTTKSLLSLLSPGPSFQHQSQSCVYSGRHSCIY